MASEPNPNLENQEIVDVTEELGEDTESLMGDDVADLDTESCDSEEFDSDDTDETWIYESDDSDQSEITCDVEMQCFCSPNCPKKVKLDH